MGFNSGKSSLFDGKEMSLAISYKSSTQDLTINRIKLQLHHGMI